MSFSSSRADHPTGLTIIESSRVGSPGALVMEHFQFRILMWDASLVTLRTKRSIIVNGRIQKSTKCLLSAMVWSGGRRKKIKMVVVQCSGPRLPNLKVGENERLVLQ